MVVVALAGGTGGLGRAFIDVWKRSFKDKHELLVLARKATPEKEREIGAKLLSADYDNESALTSLLNTNNVYTIISTMGVMDKDTQKAEGALMTAADKSTSVKRFVIGYWDCVEMSDYQAKVWHPIKWKMKSFEQIQNTSLEYTAITNGFFMDYWGMPFLQDTHLGSVIWAVDMQHKFAAIPGDGERHVAFTYSFDVAHFTWKLLDVEQGGWKSTYRIVGDRITLNEMVKAAEDVREGKFEVHYDDIKTIDDVHLKAGKLTEIPSWKPTYKDDEEAKEKTFYSNGWMLINMADGHADFEASEEVKGIVGKEFRWKSVKDIMESWRGRKSEEVGKESIMA